MTTEYTNIVKGAANRFSVGKRLLNIRILA